MASTVQLVYIPFDCSISRVHTTIQQQKNYQQWLIIILYSTQSTHIDTFKNARDDDYD